MRRLQKAAHPMDDPSHRAAFRACLAGMGALALAACGSTPKPHLGAGEDYAPNAHYKVGEPYQVDGVWYYPQEDAHYDETGMASWYGPGFEGRQTANAEIFRAGRMTAAHKTLPLPSHVQVTNLENGRSLVVRVNDRGPFKPQRIIDLSAAAADALGFKAKGLARVRVTYLGPAELPQTARARRVKSKEPLVAEAAPRRAPVTGSRLEPIPVNAPPAVAGAAPVVAALDARASAVGPRHAAGSGIYVQAGAFRSLDNAERLAHRLRTAGAFEVTRATRGGDVLYLVRLGPLDDAAEAEEALARVLAAGQTGASIVED